MKIKDLATIESFFQVAKTQSFSVAAKELKVGVPQLSKRIARLEDDLGVRLFHRTTRRVSLTEDGKALLPKVEQVIEDLKSVENSFENPDHISGIIRLACFPSLASRLLSSTLIRFCRKHRDVKFELHLTDALVDLVENNIDISIRVQEPGDSTMVFKKLSESYFILCASPDYLKEFGTPKHPNDLFEHTILIHEAYRKLCFTDGTICLRDFGSQQQIMSDSGIFLTELALQGAGITMRPIWDVKPFLKSKTLIQVLKDFPIEQLGAIYAVIPSRRYLAPRVRLFLDFLTEESKIWI